MTYPILLTYLAFILAFCGALDRILPSRFREDLATRLTRPSIATPSRSIFSILSSLFDWFFGQRLLGLRFCIASAIATIASIVCHLLIIFIFYNDAANVLVNIISRGGHPLLYVLLILLSVTFITNILSVAQTRFFLSLMVDHNRFVQFLMIGYCNLLLTATLFIVMFSAALTASLYVYDRSLSVEAPVYISLHDYPNQTSRIAEWRYADSQEYQDWYWDVYSPVAHEGYTHTFHGASFSSSTTDHTDLQAYIDEVARQIQPLNSSVFPQKTLLKYEGRAPHGDPNATPVPLEETSTGQMMIFNYMVRINSLLSLLSVPNVYGSSVSITPVVYLAGVLTGFTQYICISPGLIYVHLLEHQGKRGAPGVGKIIPVIQNWYGGDVDDWDTGIANLMGGEVRDAIPVTTFMMSTFLTSIWIYISLVYFLVSRITIYIGKVIFPGIRFFNVKEYPFTYISIVGALYLMLSYVAYYITSNL